MAADNDARLQERWRREQERRAEREAAQHAASEQARESQERADRQPSAADLQDLAEELSKQLDEFARANDLPGVSAVSQEHQAQVLHQVPGGRGEMVTSAQIGIPDHSYQPLSGGEHMDPLSAVIALVHVTTNLTATLLEWRDKLLERDSPEHQLAKSDEPARDGHQAVDHDQPEVAPTERAPDQLEAQQRADEQLAALDKRHADERASRLSDLEETKNQVLQKNPDWIGDPVATGRLDQVITDKLERLDTQQAEERQQLQSQNLVLERDDHDEHDDHDR
jgi:hypothetical protein